MRAVRASSAKLIAVSLGLQLAFAGQAAAAPPMMGGPVRIPNAVALGTGVADRVVGGSGRVAFPLELTLTPMRFWTASGGLVFSGGGVDHGYLEVGVWLGVSLAAGAGFGAYDSPQGRKEGGTLHLFVGVPIPLTDQIMEKKWFPYLEPYYRPSWGIWPGTVHEFGLMLKMLRWLKFGG